LRHKDRKDGMRGGLFTRRFLFARMGDETP
jgi:hypothetical protein